MQVTAFPKADKGKVGLDAKYILDFCTPRAFTIVASKLHHEGVRKYVSEFIGSLSNIHPSAIHDPWYPRLEDFRRLANMEWQTDAEKELASWMKKIPSFPPPAD